MYQGPLRTAQDWLDIHDGKPVTLHYNTDSQSTTWTFFGKLPNGKYSSIDPQGIHTTCSIGDYAKWEFVSLYSSAKFSVKNPEPAPYQVYAGMAKNKGVSGKWFSPNTFYGTLQEFKHDYPELQFHRLLAQPFTVTDTSVIPS